jgi:prepilin-type N-terminal cleavage/methylation domain-containing protein
MLLLLPKFKDFKIPQKGFSLVELLIVLAILSVLFVVFLARFTTFGQQVDMESASQRIVSAFQLARNQTLASEEESVYGVHFETNKYVLFKGNDYATSTDKKEYDLDKTEIYEINLLPSGTTDVIFTRVRGSTVNTGNIKIRLIDDTSRTRTVIINSLGQASLEEAVSPTDSRLTDTRHVHLDFGWSMQSSVNMRLTFTDPGFPDTVEIIAIQDFVAGSIFSWEGEVDVNGEDQELKIHSHALDPNTLLSVHRDRRYNNKALEIKVDGTTVVTYDASGSVTAGAINQIFIQ